MSVNFPTPPLFYCDEAVYYYRLLPDLLVSEERYLKLSLSKYKVCHISNLSQPPLLSMTITVNDNLKYTFYVKYRHCS